MMRMNGLTTEVVAGLSSHRSAPAILGPNSFFPGLAMVFIARYACI
jgi:precorrin-4 methylase